MRFHDLHGDGRFSFIEFARSRREREERRGKRRKALSRLGPRRWLSIALAVVRWHLASPDWATTGRREALSPLAPAYGLPYGQLAPYDGVPDVPALEALSLARLAALRDGRRSLARVLLDVHLLAVAGRENEIVFILESLATGSGRPEIVTPRERLHERAGEG